MAIPVVVLGIIAGVGAVGGIGAGINGGVKMKKASDTMSDTRKRHDKNVERFETKNSITTIKMDVLGQHELEILSSFSKFIDAYDKIRNKPTNLKDIELGDGNVLSYDPEEIKTASVGAGVLLGGLGGAVAGTAAGFAASGATTAAVMAVGCASTGTPIAALSGVAATNATLAFLGGGSLAAGGGGMALGSTMLGLSTAGVGILIGGIVFSITGNVLSNKADEAYSQMLSAEKKINKIVAYLEELYEYASNYLELLKIVNEKYQLCLNSMLYTVNLNGKTDYNEFTREERDCVQNTRLLVQLLYKMCGVQLVTKTEPADEPNVVNKSEIHKMLGDAKTTLSQLKLVNS